MEAEEVAEVVEMKTAEAAGAAEVAAEAATEAAEVAAEAATEAVAVEAATEAVAMEAAAEASEEAAVAAAEEAAVAAAEEVEAEEEVVAAMAIHLQVWGGVCVSSTPGKQRPWQLGVKARTSRRLDRRAQGRHSYKFALQKM